MQTLDPDVAIIGAGIVGSSIALALSKQGYRTLNIDKLPAAGYGSTSHSSAIIRPLYSHVTAVALAHECRSIWSHWEQFIGPGAPSGYAQYHECGGMLLIKDGEEDQFSDNIDALTQVGVEFDIIDANRIENLYPGIDLNSYGPPKSDLDPGFAQPTKGRLTSAIWVKHAGYVSEPMLAADNLKFAAERLGAEFMFNTIVTEILPNRIGVKPTSLESSNVGTNSIGTTSIGTRDIESTFIEPKIIINASGPHSGQINTLAGVTLPISTRPLQHEVVYLSAQNRHFAGGSGFIADLDSGIYSRPDGKDVLVGSADPACDEERIVDPDGPQANFSQQWTTQAMRAAQRFPELAIENSARGTIGIYDASEDWTPIYDKTDTAGYYVAIGTSGNQFKNAPLIGEIMAAVIRHSETHDRLPTSLYLENLKQSIDLSFFSRNRVVKNLSGVLA